MSLKAIADAINDQIVADMDPEPPPKFLFGPAEVFKETRPPRLVYIPVREKIVGPEGQGGDGVTDPRPLFTRIVTMDLQIWGNDDADAERLLNIVVQAMQAVAWGSYNLIGGNWDIGGDARTPKGSVYVLNMEWRVPITRRPDTYAVVSAMPLDPLTVEIS